MKFCKKPFLDELLGTDNILEFKLPFKYLLSNVNSKVSNKNPQRKAINPRPPLKDELLYPLCDYWWNDNPISDWITFLPTAKAPIEAPGRLELIWSVYWDWIKIEKRAKANVSLKEIILQIYDKNLGFFDMNTC